MNTDARGGKKSGFFPDLAAINISSVCQNAKNTQSFGCSPKFVFTKEIQFPIDTDKRFSIHHWSETSHNLYNDEDIGTRLFMTYLVCNVSTHNMLLLLHTRRQRYKSKCKQLGFEIPKEREKGLRAIYWRNRRQYATVLKMWSIMYLVKFVRILGSNECLWGHGMCTKVEDRSQELEKAIASGVLRYASTEVTIVLWWPKKSIRLAIATCGQYWWRGVGRWMCGNPSDDIKTDDSQGQMIVTPSPDNNCF